MRRKMFRAGSVLFFSLMLVLSTILHVSAAEEEEVVAKLKNRGFKEVEILGIPATGAVVTDAVFGKENGRDIVYTTANGGLFNVIDVKSNTVLFNAQLGDVYQVWTHSIAPDGTVYIPGLGTRNAGTLWSYSPETKSVKYLGVADPSHQFWSSTTDDAGNVYIGTYKEGEGKIFKYDVAEERFVDLGKIDEEGNSSYVRSLAYHDGYLYAGLGVTGNVYKINVETFEKEKITKNIAEILGSTPEEISFAYDMAVAGKYLVVRFSGVSAIVFYDLENQEWVPDKVIGIRGDGSEDDFGSFGFTQLPIHDNKTYVINHRHILEVDLETLETRETGIRYPASWRGSAFVEFGEEGESDLRLVTVRRSGEIMTVDLDAGKIIDLPLSMNGDLPLDLHSLGLGPDGNLYMTTYPGGPKGAQYNTKTGEFTSYSQGQAEGIVAGNGTDLYFGIYPGASIQKMNTDTLEVETLFNLRDEYEQDRPYIMKFENEKLLIGTIPDYQKLGGTMTIYDPTTGERETYRNIVQDQSIVGLAYKDGKIFGSTTIRGGLDIEPTAEKAKMFVWDVAGKEKLAEFELDLPELDKPPMISGLTFDEDGLLWGAVDGILFAMDPDSYEIVKYKNLYPNIKNRGMWRPVHIHFGDDGLLYTDIGGKLAVVDPKSEELDHVSLIDAGPEVTFMELAYDADGNQNIYFVDGDKHYLKMIPVIDGGQLPVEPEYETVEVPISNPGLEDPIGDGGTIPGWRSLFTISPNVSLEVTNERAKTGEYSLKITDRSQSETVFAQSDPIPVEPGIEYTGSVEMYLVDGSASFFVRYFGADGKQVGADKDGVNIIHVRGGHGAWQTVKATVVAPEGAVYARMFAGASNFFTTSGAYYDDFRFTYEREVVAVTDVEAFEDVVVEYGTAADDLVLPETARVTLSDRTEMEVSVSWDLSGYDGETAGEYRLVGTLVLSDGVTNPNGVIAEIQVVVLAEVTAGDLLDALGHQLEAYIRSGDVKGPLVNQLRNSLKQAEHHLAKGSDRKVADFVEKFLKHINNGPMQKHVSDEAKADLTERAELLLEKLK